MVMPPSPDSVFRLPASKLVVELLAYWAYYSNLSLISTEFFLVFLDLILGVPEW